MKQDIRPLLEKFIQNQCSAEETDQVVSYCKANKLTPDFPTVDDVKSILNDWPEMEPADADRIFASIMEQANEKPVMPIRKKPARRYIAIAASFLVLLTAGTLYQLGFFNTQKVPVLNGNEITLQLENGDIQVIDENGNSFITDADGHVIGNQKGQRLSYTSETGADKLVYNTLKIPYGKRFGLQLSDGTTIHLNSGTTLKYPVKFIGENRQVFLDGEAYFEVAKDAEHPFIVNADELNVRVLGTHFNVSGYPEDEATDVVLEEGSVGMYAANTVFDATKNTVLKPGFKGSFNKADGNISTKAVVTNLYTSWIDGKLMLKNMPFRNIAKKLERKYNVKIKNYNVQLANEKFNANFGDEPLEKVLSYFNDVHGIEYTIKGNIVEIR